MWKNFDFGGSAFGASQEIVDSDDDGLPIPQSARHVEASPESSPVFQSSQVLQVLPPVARTSGPVKRRRLEFGGSAHFKRRFDTEETVAPSQEINSSASSQHQSTGPQNGLRGADFLKAIQSEERHIPQENREERSLSTSKIKPKKFGLAEKLDRVLRQHKSDIAFLQHSKKDPDKLTLRILRIQPELAVFTLACRDTLADCTVLLDAAQVTDPDELKPGADLELEFPWITLDRSSGGKLIVGVQSFRVAEDPLMVEGKGPKLMMMMQERCCLPDDK